MINFMGRWQIGGFYISGPMSGYPNLNRKAFTEAHTMVCSSRLWQVPPVGIRIYNPVDFESDSSYHVKIVRDLMLIQEKRLGVILLDGWGKSMGAKLEATMAVELDLPVCLYSHLLKDGERAFLNIHPDFIREGHPENVRT
jgi:hypothetical protein